MKKTMKELEAEYLKTHTIEKVPQFIPAWVTDPNNSIAKSKTDRYQIVPTYKDCMIEIAPDIIRKMTVAKVSYRNMHTYKYQYKDKSGRVCTIFEKTIVERLSKQIWRLVWKE